MNSKVLLCLVAFAALLAVTQSAHVDATVRNRLKSTTRVGGSPVPGAPQPTKVVAVEESSEEAKPIIKTIVTPCPVCKAKATVGEESGEESSDEESSEESSDEESSDEESSGSGPAAAAASASASSEEAEKKEDAAGGDEPAKKKCSGEGCPSGYHKDPAAEVKAKADAERKHDEQKADADRKTTEKIAADAHKKQEEFKAQVKKEIAAIQKNAAAEADKLVKSAEHAAAKNKAAAPAKKKGGATLLPDTGAPQPKVALTTDGGNLNPNGY